MHRFFVFSDLCSQKLYCSRDILGEDPDHNIHLLLPSVILRSHRHHGTQLETPVQGSEAQVYGAEGFFKFPSMFQQETLRVQVASAAVQSEHLSLQASSLCPPEF